MSKLFWDIREEHELMEKLRASDPTGKWISDFVHSDNPKFAGKSKKERIRMALGASYAAKRQNEDVDIDEAAWGQDKMANLKAAHDRHAEKAIAANRAGDHEAVKVHQSKMGMIKTQMNRLRKEEVEQIDELSPALLDRAANIASKNAKAARAKGHDEAGDEHIGQAVRLRSGYHSAVERDRKKASMASMSPAKQRKYAISQKRAMGEDVEQVDELRTATMLRYATKANKSLIGGDRNKEEKRIKGIQKANYKIQTRHRVKEDAEQVDEARPSTMDDAYSGFGSIKPHRTLKVANVLKPEKDAVSRAERLMAKAGVRTNEAKSLSDYHQELRKKSGLPDPSYYLKRMKEKQAEIDALRSQSNQGSTERLHGISHDDHPGAQKTFAGQVKK